MLDKTATTHSPISVANYLLKKNGGMDRFKLNKLVYLCHAWHLGGFGAPLVNEEAEAWEYGPIYPDLYRQTKKYGDYLVETPVGNGAVAKLGTYQKRMVDVVYNAYRHLHGIQLMRMSHQVGTPWNVVRGENPGIYAKIPNTIIQNYYEERVNAEED